MKKFLLFSITLFYAIAAFAQAPTITSFTPASGPVGTLVTITGTNLSNPTAFTIGGVAAITISNTSTQLVGMVMPGAAMGNVIISTSAGTANSTSNFTVTATLYPTIQQGSKLVGTGANGSAMQGISVSVSADGNTAIVGGNEDNMAIGTAWVYSRSNGVWTQQGAKLTAVDEAGEAEFGYSVAISADGNTAIIGGCYDNNNLGAAWIFTRNGTTWVQQGPKLVGADAVGNANQGTSVCISADGNTTIVGGQNDNVYQGAAWIFTRTGNVWAQQGAKLVGTGAVGIPSQASSVYISADGNTAIIGGPSDNYNQGATWVFTRNGSTWTQQGPKLVGTGGISAGQGASVSVSADGNTLIEGGQGDDFRVSAAWIFTRNGTIWTQQGPKLVGAGAIDNGLQGTSISISADGNTAILGGFGDNSNQGAMWVFTRVGGVWNQVGLKLVGSGAIGMARQGGALSLSADGNTAIAGGSTDDQYNGTGAAWVFTSYTSSTDATLSALTVSGATLSPTFVSATKAYTTSVGYSISTTTITPVANSTSATIKVNGMVVASGSASTPIALNAGPDTVNVVVTAQDGITTQAYSIIIVRATPPPAATITSINRTAAAEGTIVTITGTNFTGATAVSFGGVPAAAFFIASATTINAVVGTGASGNVTVTTPVNEANFAGFTFIPVPTISAVGPTTFITGGSVVLNANPQTGFSYQWFRGDSTAISGATTSSYKATVSGNYRVSISLNSISQVSAPITVNSVFELPADNFQFTITGATCKGSANGAIGITASQSLSYTATITGNGLNTPYAFTSSTQINNLAAGTYDICITVAGQANFQQCFTMVIAEPKDLSVYTAVNPSGDQVVVNMDGGSEYKVMLNGILYVTEDSQITLPLVKGINTITVTTDLACQGAIVKSVNLSPEVLVYPNPFSNTLNLSLGQDNLKSALISVISVGDGKPVYTNIYNNVTGILQIDLSGLNSGLYLLRVSGDNLEKVFKIIKK